MSELGRTIAEVLTAEMHNAGIAAAGPTMSAPSPVPHRHHLTRAALQPWLRSLGWVLLAVAIGLGLFLLVWSGDRGKDDFYRAGETPPAVAGPDYAPLPVPLPARGEDASAASASSGEIDVADAEQRPRLVETAPPPAPPVAEAPPSPTAAATSRPEPIAGRTPAPRYPSRALRRGESGTVLVRVEVGIDGIPRSVSVANGSGSRLLDRAAVDAVERWRFRPALVDGRPVAGTVMVPIEFRPN
jgi:periplasmic protein TonB